MFENSWQNTSNPTYWQDSMSSRSTFPQPFSTNVLKVTSLDEAIMKSNSRNSETVYFNQNGNEFYNIRIDSNGNKSWQAFTYSLSNPNANNIVTSADLEKIIARVAALEDKFKEASNESNG